MPLVQGLSQIKWHLPHSIHGEHRGRTGKCPVTNHRVEYNYAKVLPVRIAIDKANNLSECIIEFEVLQEFPAAGIGSREERITLGKLTLNLSEYVEESEAVIRNTGYRPRGPSHAAAAVTANNGAPSSASQSHGRKRSSFSATASLTTSESGNDNSGGSSNHNNGDKAPSINEPPEAHVEDGIIRRYLMTDSKINSTLKVSILMVQLDGERHYVAPPLKSAPVFGGIAGMTSSSSHPHDPTGEFGQHFLDDPHQNTPSRDDVAAAASTSAASSNGKLRDVYELQDMYRRALAASWACQPGELPADQCIEDIFAGGDGFGPDGLLDATGASLGGEAGTPRGHHHHHHHHHHHRRHGHSASAARAKVQREDSGSSTNGGGADDFLRPPEKRTPTPSGAGRRGSHFRQGSGESTSTMRVDGGPARGGDPYLHHPPHQQPPPSHRPGHRRDSSKDSSRVSVRDGGMRSRSESLVSLAATIESERGRSGFKNAREVNESEVRDDLVAWKLPGATA